MKKYLLLKTQAGCGCDYTIKCGQKYEFVESELDIDEFIHLQICLLFIGDEGEFNNGVNTFEEIAEYYSCEKDEYYLNEFIIIDTDENVKVTLDIDMIFENMLALKSKIKEKNEQEKIKAEDIKNLADLKAKYPEQFK